MTNPVTGIDPQFVYDYSAGTVPVNSVGLQTRIDAVVSAMRRYCGWMPFPQRSETFLLDGFGQLPLLLPSLHIENLTEVKVNGKTVPLEQIEWSHTGVVYLHSSPEWIDLREPNPVPWPKRLRGIEVTATHGFDADSCMDLLGTITSTVAVTTNNPRRETSIKVGERQSSFGVGAGGLVAGTRPVGDDLAIWDKYVLPDRTWSGG